MEKFETNPEIANFWAEKLRLKIFPTNPYTKAPCIRDPFSKATNNDSDIDALFRGFGNVVMAPRGPINGITVFDLDRKKGVDGLKTFWNWELNYLRHLSLVHLRRFSRYLSSGQPSNSAGAIAPGIDVRGHGGYIIGPGSQPPMENILGKVNIFLFLKISHSFSKGWLS